MTLKAFKSLLLILGLAFASGGISQTQTERKVKTFESEYWMTPDSSPLLFKVEERSGEISIEVRSNGKVVGYQYGCITVQGGKLVAIKKLGALKIDLTKEEPILYREFFNLAARTDCKAPTKLGIIAVDFQDGGSWILNTSKGTKK
jgi:hypothetical protein